jgi:hypothetical protein
VLQVTQLHLLPLIKQDSFEFVSNPEDKKQIALALEYNAKRMEAVNSVSFSRKSFPELM